MQRKSIKEIARLAQVSIGTVDRVLHDRGRVAPQTEERVRAIIRELDYKPNMFASALKTGKTFRFAVLMPQPGPFCEYWELPLNGIRKAARELAPLNVRVDSFFFDLSAGPAGLREAAARLKPADLDGLIMAPVLAEEFSTLIAGLPAELPYVFFDSFLPQARPLTVIGQDSHRAGRVAGQLMSLLLPQGGEVVVIRNLPCDFHLQEREKGFGEYLAARAGFRTVVEEVDLAAEGSKLDERIAAIARRHPTMDGLFVNNANTFPYARLSRKQTGTGRVVCVGFDLLPGNIDGLRQGSIDFLISQKPEEYGYRSVSTLYRHLALKETVPAHISTPVEIVCRENLAGPA